MTGIGLTVMELADMLFYSAEKGNLPRSDLDILILNPSIAESVMARISNGYEVERIIESHCQTYNAGSPEYNLMVQKAAVDALYSLNKAYRDHSQINSF
ncbi:hypothetical protein HYU11_00320 [Candidatus Woesearchaeota archaeon]|nr:hypothetical protein [Candidatus Woesearchaeota archaeon]